MVLAVPGTERASLPSNHLWQVFHSCSHTPTPARPRAVMP